MKPFLIAAAVLWAAVAMAQVPPGPPPFHPPLGPPGIALGEPHPQPFAPPVTVRDVSFQSTSLARAMKYRIILPADYSTSARRYPVLYLLHGLTGSYLDWESRTHLVEYVQPLPLIVVMPDAGDSWYTNSAGVPQDKFEDYVVKDLIEEVDKNYRTLADRHGRAVAGLSMGGYGALKFALKHPALFFFAGSLSGAQAPVHDPTHNVPFGQKYIDGLRTIFGNGATPTLAENDIFAFVTKAEGARVPYLYVGCGTEDGLLQSNRDFVALVQKQKIRYEYREARGAHSWEYWDRELPGLLQAMEREMRAAR